MSTHPEAKDAADSSSEVSPRGHLRKSEKCIHIERMLHELELHPVAKPMNPHCIRFQYAKTLENQFNQFWYHMYKILLDIEARRYALNGPKVLEERRLLTEYARRAVSLWSTRAGSLEPLAGETGADLKQQADKELSKVKYLDAMDVNSKAYEMQDVYQSKHTSKYKERVLAALSIPGADDLRLRTPETPKHHDKQELEGSTPMIRASRQSPLRVAPGPNKLSRTSVRAARRKGAKISQFGSNCQLEDFRPGPIFRHDVLFAVDRYSIPADLVASAARATPAKLDPQLPVFSTPYTNHIRACIKRNSVCSASTARDSQPSPSTPAKDLQQQQRQNIIEQVVDRIYGKKNRQACMTSGTEGRNCRSPEMFIRQRQSCHSSLRKPTACGIKKEAAGFFLTERKCRAFRPKQPAEGMRRNCTSVPGSRKSSPKRGQNKLKRLLENCVEEQLEADEELDEAQQLHHDVATRLKNIQSVMDQDGVTERANMDIGRYVRHVTYYKHLFIYGKNGGGRFLAMDGRDMIKASDQMSRINPRYGFLKKRMSEIIIKQPLF